MIFRALSKHRWVGLAATTASTAAFAYLYRGALQDVARVEAEVRADELANEAWVEQYDMAKQAYEARIT